MAAGRIVQSVFSAGELSPRLQDRADLRVFAEGAARLENLIVLREGGAIRRSGFEHVAMAASSDHSVLIAFVKSTQDTLVIEASEESFRFFIGSEASLLTGGGGVVTVNTPFSSGDLDALYEWQSADVMWFTQTDGARPPHVLIRYSDDDWGMLPYDVREGPFLNRTFDKALITPSANIGDITLSSNADVFLSGHVGGLFILYQGPGSAKAQAPSTPYKVWKAGEGGIAFNDLRSFAGRIYQCKTNGTDLTAGSQAPVHDYGAVSDGALSWAFLHDGAGVVQITGVSGPRAAVATVRTRLPETLATSYWAEGAFSPLRGYPRLGGIFEERLFFLSTPAQPDTMFASRAGEYSPTGASFKPGLGSGAVDDSDAVTRTLADSQVNHPSWMIARDRLLFGTPRGVVRVSGPSVDEAIVPASAVARRIPNSVGAYERCCAVEAAERVLYPARGGRRLIEMAPDAASARDLTARAEQVGAAQIRQLAWCGEPDGRLFARLSDGALWCLTYAPDEDVAGWSRIIPGGAYEGGPAQVDSIAAAPDGDGYDRLWAIIRRGSAASPVRTVERLGLDYRLGRSRFEAACFLDGAARWNVWNGDAGVTATLTMDGGAPPEHGRRGGVALSGASPFVSADLGRELWLRKKGVDHPPLRLTITSVNSASQVSVELKSDGDPAQLQTSEWALTISNVQGLFRFASQTVGVFMDGIDEGDVTVDGSGFAQLPWFSAEGCIGWRAPWLGRSMPIVLQAPLGDSRGAAMRVEAMRVGFVDALAAKVAVITEDEAERSEEVIVRQAADLMGEAVQPRSGQFRELVEARRAKKVQVQVSGSDAYPFTLTSVSAEVVVDD